MLQQSNYLMSDWIDLIEWTVVKTMSIRVWKVRMIKHFWSFSYLLLKQNRALQLVSCFTNFETRIFRYQRSYILPKLITISVSTHFGSMGQSFWTSAPSHFSLTKKESILKLLFQLYSLFFDSYYFLFLFGTSLSF